MSRTVIPFLSLSSSAITRGIIDSNKLNCTIWALPSSITSWTVLYDEYGRQNPPPPSWNNLQFHLQPDLVLISNAWKQQNCRSWFVGLENLHFPLAKIQIGDYIHLYSWNHKVAKFWWTSLLFYTTLWGVFLYFLHI